MNSQKIKRLLVASILIMALGPMTGAFIALNSVINATLNIAFNAEVYPVLKKSAENLKKLRALDKENEDDYFLQFQQIENLKLVYSEPKLVRQKISSSVYLYFAFATSVAILASILIAFFLSHVIARSYSRIFSDLIRQKEKISFLEEISAWQELAKMLAHEIKNPLTPIEILISSLPGMHKNCTQSEFHARLKETEHMIYEELDHLKIIVDRFSDFSNVPEVKPEKIDLNVILSKLITTIPTAREDNPFRVNFEPNESPCNVLLDSNMFRQVLTNIVRNGIEANPGTTVDFDISLRKHNHNIQLAITNSGKPIPVEKSEKIFEPYYSSKNHSANMGLGLALVKKIIIEHGGDIRYQKCDGLPSFVISLNESQ